MGAHAHNDYEHERPLLDALDHGFRSIEVDVHLVDGDLLVAHDRDDVEPSRTLQSLYLDPLRERIRRRGSVYGEGTPLLLLVDVKSEAETTYRALRSVLRGYADILTIYAGDAAVDGAVTVIISGARAREAMRNEAIRFAAFDGRPGDLDAHAGTPSTFTPLISAPWTTVSTWRGEGPMPRLEREKLRRLVAGAHARGRMLRFWATPDTSAVWDVLTAEGVDLIGADDLTALRDYFGQRAPRPARD